MEMNNRRGIFITNCISKVWEKVLLNSMQHTMEIDVHQNGGQKGRNTIDNLLAIHTAQQTAKRLNQECVTQFSLMHINASTSFG